MTGALFLAICAALLVARRSHPPAVALAVYVGSLGFLYAVNGFTGGRGFGPVPAPLIWVAEFAAAGALVRLALIFPNRLEGRARADALFAGAYAVAFVVLLIWYGDDTTRALLVEEHGWQGSLVWLGERAIAAASIATGLLLPLRARRFGAHEGDAMRAVGIIAVALFLLSPGGPWPGIVRSAHGEFSPPRVAMVVVQALIGLLLWLAATRGEQARGARNTLLALVVCNLGLGALHQITEDMVVQIGRLLSALLLTYAVVAGQIAGLDLKIRFAISRSTLAAVFIAAFFIASEGAQILFGQGNEWLGLLGAGALVFALAPLQRAAERLAERAVPVAAGPASVATSATLHEEAYKASVRLALRGGITREEEFELARIAEAHGITHVRALVLRTEVEQHSSGKPEGRKRHRRGQ